MKTPRTDAERRSLKKSKSYPPDPVSAEFARQLETELIAMTALADRLAEALKGFTEIEYLYALGRSEDSEQSVVYSQHDSAARALAAYENHKKQTP